MNSPQRPGSAVVTAMVCSGLLTAQLVGGKAVRDSLFLARLDVTSLPAMIIVASLVSMAVVVAFSMATTRLTPAKVIPAAYAGSAALLLVEWLLTRTSPTAAAILVYLHVSAILPVLASGFWLIATEQFDPRTARTRFGRIAGAGTAGGVLGGLLADRAGAMFGVAAVLPVLAALNIAGAWGIRLLAVSLASPARQPATAGRDAVHEVPGSGLRALAEIPYIRHLAALVMLGTMSAAFVDYIFKVQAVGTLGRGDGLLRFFSAYYAATSVVTFVVQTSSSQFLLQRFGLALVTSMPSIALLAGSAIGLVIPGFASVTGARGSETIFRGSLFRYGYELFYTPIPAGQKRAVKSIIDVGFDRLGDVAGAGLIRGVLLLGPSYHYSTILFLGLFSSGAAVIVASRLNRGYIATLEKSLMNQGLELDLSDTQDMTTRTTLLRTLTARGPVTRTRATDDVSAPGAAGGVTSTGVNASEVQDVIRLRSRDHAQIVAVLRREEGVAAALVPHVIPLLGWNPVSADAVFALRKVAEERVGQLIDALIDPSQDFAVRRRLARVFSVCVSQRAADGLMLGLDDLRFEVRFQCGRSLLSVLETNPRVRIDSERLLQVVLRETAVGRHVWESRRLLDDLEPGQGPSAVDDFVRERAGQSLAHVFTLLSLVLPREPLQIAFRGLQTGDQHLRGTALEYLEGVLPAAIRERLWPFLEDSRPASRAARPREQIFDDLLRSNHSIMVNLKELRQRDQDAPAPEPRITAGGSV